MNFPAFTLALISAIQLVFAHTTRQLNNRPVFGIITEPTGTWGSHYGDAFIAASYVKFLEMGGAQVVPIIHTRPIEEIEQLLDWLNGALFPGGGVDIATPSTYLTVVETIYNHAIQANKAKPGSFVLHGTCLGFEELAVVTANNADVLSSFNAENVSLPLDFTSYASQSKMFGNAPAYIMEIFETKPVTMNNHQEGVSPATFQATPALNSFFNVISTNTDKSGNVFLSTWESKLYPIFGTQWHPEKNPFEWNPYELINHSADAIIAAQWVANFLVDQARNSDASFPSDAVLANYSIYQYDAIYTWPIVNDYEQCYFFN